MTIVWLCGIAGILGTLATGTGNLLYDNIPGSTQTLFEKISSLPKSGWSGCVAHGKTPRQERPGQVQCGELIG
jgi:hypothetical protein